MTNSHPTLNPDKTQYLIGYGSLMNEKSKRNTAKGVGNNMPIILTGYKRGWLLQTKFPIFKTTFLDIQKDKKSNNNTVIYQLKQKTNAS